MAEGTAGLLGPARTAAVGWRWAGAGALLVALSAHLILVFPANVMGLVGGFACYFRGLGRCGTAREGLRVGAVFGGGLAAGCLYWLGDVFHVLAALERAVGAVVVGGFCVVVALPYALWGLLSGRTSGRRRGLPWLWAQAPGLLLAQWLFQDVGLDFPWLHGGYWLANGPLDVWLGWVGAFGAGLLLLHLAACLGLWGLLPQAPRQALLAAVVLSAGVLLPRPAAPDAEAPGLRVAVVALADRPEEDRAHEDVALLSRYVVASREVEADWLVWPESVIRDGDVSLAPLGTLLARPGRHVLAGALLVAPEGGRYNALVELGSGRPLRYKQKRVPFSEYLPGTPVRWLFARMGVNTLKADVREWTGPQPPAGVGGVTVVPLLCFEVAFSSLARAGEGPAVLLDAGNEGWFDSALLHRMTLAMGLTRALEQGLPLVRAVAGGYSGFFEPASRTWVAGAEGRPVRVVPRPPSTPYGRLLRRLER